jgi:hypothetical protein
MESPSIALYTTARSRSRIIILVLAFHAVDVDIESTVRPVEPRTIRAVVCRPLRDRFISGFAQCGHADGDGVDVPVVSGPEAFFSEGAVDYADCFCVWAGDLVS